MIAKTIILKYVNNSGEEENEFISRCKKDSATIEGYFPVHASFVKRTHTLTITCKRDYGVRLYG